MKRSVILGISLALNAGLLAGLHLLCHALAAKALPARPLRLAAGPAAAQAAASKPADSNPVAAPTPEPAAASSSIPFHWSQIASTNYLDYRDRLRAIGCPEPTLRDILRAEINAEYQARRQPLVTEFQQQYWTLAAARTIEPADPDDWRKAELDRLGEEREQRLEAVLGETSREDTARNNQLQRERWAETYAWLPEDKREALLGLLETHARRLDELKAAAAQRGGDWTAADDAQRKVFDQELDRARTQLLSPEELDEYRLRSSGGARWAQNVAGFEPTEDEWRAVARLKQSFNDAAQQLNRSSLSQAEKEARRKELEAALESETRTTLGAERYVELERARDGQYDSLRRVVQRHGCTDDLAVRSYELVKTAQEQMRQVSNNPDLPADTRAATLQALRAEAASALRQTLGATVFETYQEYGGSWLHEPTSDGAP